MDKKQASKVPILKIRGNQHAQVMDTITTEAPLEISLSLPDLQPKIYNKSISITMRTPGADTALALGFLYSEGIITGKEDILETYTQEHKVHFVLNHTTDSILSKLDRHFYTSSSCGVCGKSSIEAIQPFVSPKKGLEFKVNLEVIKSLPQAMRKAQQVFELTGGIHAAGLFSDQGELINITEDVGRHNAVDKIIGYTLINKADLSKTILVLSGRISFELVHKAAVASIPIVAAIGAPSSLAIETAEAFDLTLVGFLKNEGFNCYNGAHRLDL